nr:hypothetical protein [uncultured Brumimicrobium sp.]
MKKIIYLLSIVSLAGCATNKNVSSKTEKAPTPIIGLYMSEEVPADIGQPYRVFLNISDDSVWIANFSKECTLVKQMTTDSYDNRTAINKGTPLSFSFDNTRLTFVDNQEVQKQYKALYKCIHQSVDSVIFEVSNYWFDGQLFYQTQQTYYPCE